MSLKRRLGVVGALTLLCLAALPIIGAGAQTTTGEFDVQVKVDNGSAGTAAKEDFSFTLDGGAPQQFNPTGVNILTGLDTSVPHSIAAVDFPGYTVTLDENIPGITCTNVTIDPATPAFCRMTFTFIEPITTTTTTTTTTTLPPTTTTGKAGQTTIHDSGVDVNNCTVVLDPNLQPPGKSDITVTVATDASPQPHFGDPITLSGTTLTLKIPAALLQVGADAGLIKNGDQVPSTIKLTVAGSDTTEGKHTYSVNSTATIVIKGGKAQPLEATVGLPNTVWHPVDGTSDVHFTQVSMGIVSKLNLPGIGNVTVTFTCDPRTSGEFIAVGATGVASTTVPPTLPPNTTPGSGGSGGSVTPQANGGSSVLPVTGSSSAPLFAIGAGLASLGLLALGGSKRRRGPLHRS